jgi:hypothetical protein
MADITPTAANVLASSSATIVNTYLAGATITAGQVVYLNTSLQWALVDSNAAATGNAISNDPLCGFALHGAAANQPLDVAVRDTDFTPGGTLTNGSTVYTSTNAGGFTHDVPASGAYPRVLGVAKSTTKMNLNPTASGAVI